MAIQEMMSFFKRLRISYLWPYYDSRLWCHNMKREKWLYGRCRSLNLINGEHCEHVTTNRYESRCTYHQYQFRVFTAYYHVTKRERFNGISESSIAFVEFMLRKLYDRVYFLFPDSRHWCWYAKLYGDIMQLPYNITNMENMRKLLFFSTAIYLLQQILWQEHVQRSKLHIRILRRGQLQLRNK